VAALEIKKVSKKSKPIVVLTFLSWHTGVIQIQKYAIWPFLPPHHHKLAMKTYIEHLNKLATMAVSKQTREHIGTVRPVFEPLETQITRWWANLPQSSRERAFLISEIAGVCRGRFKERPALRDVAAALRTMGWTQQRDWRKAGNNRRVWMKQ
jgi:hypothetical protein